jgi:hypothetical protein
VAIISSAGRKYGTNSLFRTVDLDADFVTGPEWDYLSFARKHIKLMTCWHKALPCARSNPLYVAHFEDCSLGRLDFAVLSMIVAHLS